MALSVFNFQLNIKANAMKDTYIKWFTEQKKDISRTHAKGNEWFIRTCPALDEHKHRYMCALAHEYRESGNYVIKNKTMKYGDDPSYEWYIFPKMKPH